MDSFIITDDMISNSTDVYLKVVKDEGYLEVEKLMISTCKRSASAK